MAFEAGNGKKNGQDLWDFRGESAGKARLVKDAEKKARKSAASSKTKLFGTRPYGRKPSEIRPSGTKQGTSSPTKLFAFVFVAVICVIAAYASMVYVRKEIAKPSETEQIKTEFIGDAGKVSMIASMLPYPKGVTYDHIEIQSYVRPYELTIYTKGLDGAAQIDFQSSVLFLFGAIDNLDEVHFKDVDSDKAFTFTRSSRWLLRDAPNI